MDPTVFALINPDLLNIRVRWTDSPDLETIVPITPIRSFSSGFGRTTGTGAGIGAGISVAGAMYPAATP